MTIALSAHIAACEELESFLDSPKSITSGYCENEIQLRELWEIDREAYGDLSLQFEPFLQWWQAYNLGSRNLLIDGRIAASIGIYPIAPAQMNAFVAGEIREGILQPMKVEECEASGCDSWYCSGIVVRPELKHRGLLRPLLNIGIGSWLNAGHTSFPVRLMGIAEYDIGAKLLKKFGFSKVKDGAEMPDGCDIYMIEFRSPEEARSLLRARGF